MHSIQTNRLIVRPMQVHDEALFARIYCDADMMRHVGKPLDAKAAARAFHATLAQARESPWRRLFHVMTLRDRGTEIGLVGLVRSAHNIASADIGIMILADWQARGFAFEGLSVLIGLAFGKIGLDNLHADHARENQCPIGFLKRLGFEPVPGVSERLFWMLHRDGRKVQQA